MVCKSREFKDIFLKNEKVNLNNGYGISIVKLTESKKGVSEKRGELSEHAKEMNQKFSILYDRRY